jgi:hypothetical protein
MSHTARGRTFKKGQPQILTNAGDVAFYQSLKEFRVAVMETPTKKKVKSKDAPAKDPDETRPGMESAVMAAEERKRSTDDDGKSETGSKKKKTKKRSSRG